MGAGWSLGGELIQAVGEGHSRSSLLRGEERERRLPGCLFVWPSVAVDADLDQGRKWLSLGRLQTDRFRTHDCGNPTLFELSSREVKTHCRRSAQLSYSLPGNSFI